MTTWRAQSVQNRPGERHRKTPDPEQLHDFYPSRQPDDDTCTVCHRAWEASVHIPIGPDEPDI